MRRRSWLYGLGLLLLATGFIAGRKSGTACRITFAETPIWFQAIERLDVINPGRYDFILTGVWSGDGFMTLSVSDGPAAVRSAILASMRTVRVRPPCFVMPDFMLLTIYVKRDARADPFHGFRYQDGRLELHYIKHPQPGDL